MSARATSLTGEDQGVGRDPPSPDDFNTVWDKRPPAPTRDMPVEVNVVGRRCVYVNSRRIAGGKPYVGEGLPSFTYKTTLGDVLDAFSDKEIRAALREKRARADYFKAYHGRKAAALARSGELS